MQDVSHKRPCLDSAVRSCDADSVTWLRRIRNGETNLGDLIADSFRAVYGTDIGFVNGGGLRAAIPAGDITYSSLMNVMRYNNTVHAARVTGQQLLDLLEFSSAAYPGESGAFLHVSGMTYAIDPAIPSSVTTNEFGEFTGVTAPYRVKNVMIGDGVPRRIRCLPQALIRHRIRTPAPSSRWSGRFSVFRRSRAGPADPALPCPDGAPGS